MKPEWSRFYDGLRTIPASEDGIEHFRRNWTKKYVEDPELKPVDLLTSTEDESKQHALDTITLFDIGSDLNGYTDTIHGRVLCASLDESLSVCVEIHRARSPAKPAGAYTVRLATDFRGMVNSPIVLIVKSKFEIAEGRKWFLRGTIEDENGRVLTQAEGIWVSVKEKL
ncbi:hypothetical protein LTR84_004663 [Exophiala bonariae]|uniref:Thioesterase domain-containing protein n=1 Tax=Exophiala bonariae TaxID=1690606 RepID=A0AAV9NN03_9EURO|nr:hypothetical protein LTR84_004663 [Exophiala bonariae]